MVAISLDIKNAFNSLPWNSIINKAKDKNLPEYLVYILRHYLFERKISYHCSDGLFRERDMYAGVPQGSLLGPTLWILTYDWVLQAVLRSRGRVLCYADDTFVMAWGNSPAEAAMECSLSTVAVTERIKRMGLVIAVDKTETIIFSKKKISSSTDFC